MVVKYLFFDDIYFLTILPLVSLQVEATGLEYYSDGDI